MSKITDFLTKMGLDEDNQKKLEDAIKALIEEKVSLKSEEKTTLLENEYKVKFEVEVNEKVEAEKQKLVEANEQYQKDFEKNMIDTLDAFLDSQINENISDKALEKVAINETAEPIVNGIKKLFEENHLELDSEGDKLLKSEVAKNEKLEEQNSDLINKNMELNKLNEDSAIKIRLNEATKDLTEKEAEKVNSFCEGKTFDDIDKKVDNYVSMIVEENNEKDNKVGNEEKKNLNEDVKDGDDNCIDDKKSKSGNNSLANKAANLLY